MAETKYAIAEPRMFRANTIGGQVVPAGLTPMAFIQTQGIDELFVELGVTVAPLTGLTIQARSSDAAAYVTLYSTSADFISPKGMLIGTSGDLTTQAAGTTGWFILRVRPFSQILISASSGGTAVMSVTSGGE